jgi:hypothetical protein
MATKRLGNLSSDKTVFFLCDMQQKFRNAIKYFEEITEVSGRLVSKCHVAQVETFHLKLCTGNKAIKANKGD